MRFAFALVIVAVLPWPGYGQSTWRVLPSRFPTNPKPPPRQIEEEEEEADPWPPLFPTRPQPQPQPRREPVRELPREMMPSREAYAPYKATGAEPAIKLVGSKKIRLNVQLKNVGPSGVDEVEIWGTQTGAVWRCYAKESEAKPPFTVEVPEEGRYGFTVLLRSGAGLARRPPEAGEKPQIWIEVDLTKPTLRLDDLRLGAARDQGALTIAYSARDRNLEALPMSFAYAAKPEGPWTTIASKQENTGRFTWKPAPGVPYKVFLKVEAIDKAGNVASVITDKSMVTDLNQPEGVIIGVDPDK